MSKIQKTIKGILEIIKNPWLLNHVLNDDSVWQKKIKQAYQIEYGLPLLSLDAIFPEFKENLNCFAFLDGGSLPTDIALLKMLARRFNQCKYFEIGTWRGESVVNIAEVADECFTLNLSKEAMQKLNWNEQYIDLHGFFSKDKKNIVHITGDSMNYDFAALNKKFDLIFIDGNHHYDYVKNDTEKIFKHLVHDKSIVVWHDYAYNPEKVRPEVFKAILDGTPKAFRNNLYHVANTMCAVFTRETFATDILNPPMTPTKHFKVNIEIS